MTMIWYEYFSFEIAKAAPGAALESAKQKTDKIMQEFKLFDFFKTTVSTEISYKSNLFRIFF